MTWVSCLFTRIENNCYCLNQNKICDTICYWIKKGRLNAAGQYFDSVYLIAVTSTYTASSIIIFQLALSKSMRNLLLRFRIIQHSIEKCNLDNIFSYEVHISHITNFHFDAMYISKQMRARGFMRVSSVMLIRVLLLHMVRCLCYLHWAPW